jgi:hypothetical protein
LKINLKRNVYLYLIFNNNISVITKIETVFAAITGALDISSPYISHDIKPSSIIINVISDRSFVSFVLIVFIDWGRNAKVVKNAAMKPIKVEKSKYLLYLELYV